MITIQDIIESSKPHPKPPGRHTRMSNGIVEVSIVGGSRGLYGDFKNTFEVAIFDSKTREFKTKTFFPENNDDVVAYMDTSKLVELTNKIFIDGNFQVL